jgi:hypothetical protein
MKKNKRRIAVAFYAVVLLAALYALFRMRHFDWGGYEDSLFEHETFFIYRFPMVTVPAGHPVNIHDAGKDQ